jgi:hypothetical protein
LACAILFLPKVEVFFHNMEHYSACTMRGWRGACQPAGLADDAVRQGTPRRTAPSPRIAPYRIDLAPIRLIKSLLWDGWGTWMATFRGITKAIQRLIDFAVVLPVSPYRTLWKPPMVLSDVVGNNQINSTIRKLRLGKASRRAS